MGFVGAAVVVVSLVFFLNFLLLALYNNIFFLYVHSFDRSFIPFAWFACGLNGALVLYIFLGSLVLLFVCYRCCRCCRIFVTHFVHYYCQMIYLLFNKKKSMFFLWRMTMERTKKNSAEDAKKCVFCFGNLGNGIESCAFRRIVSIQIT